MFLDESARQFDIVHVSHGGAVAATADEPRAAGTVQAFGSSSTVPVTDRLWTYHERMRQLLDRGYGDRHALLTAEHR
jgi:hypothetical protein